MRELSVAEQRYQAVLAVISDGLSISQVAQKVGVSASAGPAMDKWIAYPLISAHPGKQWRMPRPATSSP